MTKAKIFKNGQSEAVRLPKEFRFKTKEVFVNRLGNAVILFPTSSPWVNLLKALDAFSADFLTERSQPLIQKRRGI